MKKVVAAIALTAALSYVPSMEACNLDLKSHISIVPETKIVLSTVPPKDKDEQRRREAGRIGRQVGQEVTNEVRRRVNPKIRDAYDDTTRVIRDIEQAVRRGKQDGKDRFPFR